MFNSISIKKDVYYVGVNDRRLALFENLWPLPHGVSLNSYLIVDEKVALIDTVIGGQLDQYLEKIRSILGENKNIDYLIINHMEPDHSGALKSIVHHYPDIKIVGNSKTFWILKDFYGIEKNLYEIKDGDTLSLGNHNLKFYMTPMVHWPETMMTYDETNNIIFTGDAFGSFGALDGGIYDDEVDWGLFEVEMRRYYSNIVGKYGMTVQNALKKIKDVNIKVICPSHGPIWRDDVNKVISLYDKWSKYESDEGVVIVYGTMYGNSAKMAETIAIALVDEGIKNIKIYDSSKTHMSYIFNDIFKYKGLIIGTCTYNGGSFPPIEAITNRILNTGLKNKLLGLFGTYTWTGGGVKTLENFATESKFEIVHEPVRAKSSASKEDLEACKNIAKSMAKSLKELRN